MTELQSKWQYNAIATFKIFEPNAAPTNKAVWKVEDVSIHIEMEVHLACLSNLFGLKAFNF